MALRGGSGQIVPINLGASAMTINDGVTLASRAAKLRPGVLVPAEVIQDLPRLDVTRMPTVKDSLP